MNDNNALATLSTATTWRKSTRSEGQNVCVEVTTEVPGWIGVRDTKLGAQSPILAITAVGWTTMIAAARRGELDR